jgi:hypothetical protein
MDVTRSDHAWNSGHENSSCGEVTELKSIPGQAFARHMGTPFDNRILDCKMTFKSLSFEVKMINNGPLHEAVPFYK